MPFIVGPPGSGKATLLSMVSGILRPNGGKVSVRGADIWTLGNDQLADFRLNMLGIVFQDYQLFPPPTKAKNSAMITFWNLGLAFGRVLLIAGTSSCVGIREVLKVERFGIFRG
jgi:ABC-type lipoprotein export system ATPase subunit